MPPPSATGWLRSSYLRLFRPALYRLSYSDILARPPFHAPQGWQAHGALSQRDRLVPQAGVEPATSTLSEWCSNQAELPGIVKAGEERFELPTRGFGDRCSGLTELLAYRSVNSDLNRDHHFGRVRSYR